MSCVDIIGEIQEESHYETDVICCNVYSDADRPELKEKTKEVYRKSALEFHGEQKLDDIVARYGYKKSFSKTLEDMKGLDPYFVRKIAIGTTRFRIKDLTPHLDGKRPESIPFDRKERLFKQINPNPCFGKRIIPYIPTTPHTLKSQFFYDPALQDKELVQLNAISKKLTSRIEMDEILAKGFVPRDLEKGDIFYYGKNHYQVYDIIVTATGFVGYAFKPLSEDQKELDPIIAIGPTKFYFAGLDASKTIIDDLGSEMGDKGYFEARAHVQQWLLDHNFCKEQVRLVCFSLGSVYAQRILTDFHEKVKEATFFCSPGVSLKRADIFCKRYEKNPTPLKITYYRISSKDGDDWCDHLGEAFIGLGVKNSDLEVNIGYIEPHPELELPFIAGMHTQRYFSDENARFDLTWVEKEKVQEHLFNESRGKRFYLYEKVRQLAGPYFLVPILSCIISIGRFFCPSRAQAKAKQLATKFFHPEFDIKDYQRPMLTG